MKKLKKTMCALLAVTMLTASFAALAEEDRKAEKKA